MGLRHTAVMLLFASILLGGVISSNMLVGVERTALDADFAKETLDEEKVYSTALTQVEDRIGNQTGEDLPFDIGAILTQEYIRTQAESNIDAFYDYLHGRNDTLVLGIDTSPLKDRLAAELEDMIRDQQLANFDPQLARMTANETSYQTERASFRQDQLDQIQESTADNLSQQELEDTYDQRKAALRQQLLEETEQDGSGPTAIQEATQDILTVKIDGLLNESLTYEEFMTAFNASIEDLAAAQAEQAAAQMNENIPQNINVTAELDGPQRERIDRARDGLSMFRLLVIIVPLLTAGIAGLMWVLAGSQSGALLGIGHTIALGGLLSTGLTAAAKRLAVPELQQMLAADAPSTVSEIGIGIIEQLLDVFLIQSAAILVFGLLILTAGIVLRRREGETGPEDTETDGTTGEESTDHSPDESPDEAKDHTDEDNGYDPEDG